MSGPKEKPIGVVPSRTAGMFRLIWSDGVESADHYNLDRAKDILRNYVAYRYAMRMNERPQNQKWDTARRVARRAL